MAMERAVADGQALLLRRKRTRQKPCEKSNRNFEGPTRQGKDGRTHLVSPHRMAAAAAIAGHFVDIREWNN